MSYEIHITETAERDMSEAADYIEFVLKNPDAADHLLDKADEVISSLAEFPQRIKLVGDSFLSALGIRAVSVNNYLAFFIVSEAEKRVTIVRFMYEKRDWITILKLDQSAIGAIQALQNQMQGEAEKAGLYTEDDVIHLVKEIRHEKE